MVNHFIRYQTKPNATVQAPVQPGVFTHDCSVLLTVPPPGKYIHGGRSGEGRGKKEEKSTTCEQQNIFFLFYTWPKTINAATSLLYCRFVHGTVHPLYRTDMLITTLLTKFKHFNTIKPLLW